MCHPQKIMCPSMRDRPRPRPQYIVDCETLTRTELQRKYKLTYSSWRNMKQRRHKEGAVIAPEFEDFVSFLAIMGPRVDAQMTIHRLFPPLYGPGVCVWADKKRQGNERSTTVTLTYDGEALPLTTWAARTGQDPNTLRRRKQRGWEDHEVIMGRANGSEVSPTHNPGVAPRDPYKWRPWRLLFPNSPKEQADWERRYQRNGVNRNDDTKFRLYFFLSELNEEYSPWHDYLSEGSYAPGYKNDPEYQRIDALAARNRELATVARDLWPKWQAVASAWTQREKCREEKESDRFGNMQHHRYQDDHDEDGADDEDE